MADARQMMDAHLRTAAAMAADAEVSALFLLLLLLLVLLLLLLLLLILLLLLLACGGDDIVAEAGPWPQARVAELEAEEAHLEALVASQPQPRRQASPPEGEAPPEDGEEEDGEGEGLRGHRTPSGKMRYEL